MKGLLFGFAVVVACICLLAAPLTAQAGGHCCHAGVAVVNGFAVVQQAVPVAVYSPAVVVQQQAFVTSAVPVYFNNQAVAVANVRGFSQAQAFAGGGGASAQAVANGGGFGSRAVAASFSGPPRPLRNAALLLAAAVAARRGGSFAAAGGR